MCATKIVVAVVPIRDGPNAYRDAVISLHFFFIDGNQRNVRVSTVAVAL